MESAQSPEITSLLKAWAGGDRAALERLTPLVYAELRRRARRYMANQRPGNTLQTSALVNEAYLRLVELAGTRWQDRAHFFALSAKLMRRILVDATRARTSEKRGGAIAKVNLDASIIAVVGRRRELVALDDALNALAQFDGRKAEVVEMRFFGGLSIAETAEVLKISEQSVRRDWQLARSWLVREMNAAQTE